MCSTFSHALSWPIILSSCMPLTVRILGGAGQDNAALVRIDSGQTVTRLLLEEARAVFPKARFPEGWVQDGAVAHPDR